MKVRSICASLMVTVILVISGGAVSASAATSDMQPRKATSCIEGGRVAVNQDFGPDFKWTLIGIRYPGNSQCNLIRTNSGYSGTMKLKLRMITISDGVVTSVIKKTVRCFGCAELSYGTGGYDKVKIKAMASPRGSTKVFKTPWRTVVSR